MKDGSTKNFAQSMVFIRNAQNYMESLKKESMSPIMKNLISQYAKRLKWILDDFHTRISADVSQKLKDQMFNMESSLQVQNIMDMLFDCNQETRDAIETFIEGVIKGDVKIES